MFEQRKFASDNERTKVLNALAANGIDTVGQESTGWLLANLYISRPLPKHADPEDPH